MFVGILLVLIFIFFAALMYLKKLPALLALPLMAMCLYVVGSFAFNFNAGIPFIEVIKNVIKGLLKVVISDGSVRLSNAIFAVIFGSILAQVVKETGIAKTLIRFAAELGGDKPVVVATVLTIVTALLFSVLGGLGGVIMVASLIFPILLSLGIHPQTVGCVFLLGLSLGGTFNFANWQLYKDVLGLTQAQIFSFALPFGGLFFVTTFIFLFLDLKKEKPIYTFSVPEKSEKLNILSLFTPIIPIVLVFGMQIYNRLRNEPTGFEFPIITAMLVGIIYGILTAVKNGEKINTLMKCTYESFAEIAPAVALMIGIGMLFVAVTSTEVSTYMAPLISKLLPSSKIGYLLFFSILAPLALYRGPFNLWGMGSGLVAIILASKTMSAPAIMAALMSVGMIQGVCDPTNTHNVWVANYLKIDVQIILKKTLPYMWILAVVGLLLGSIFYY